MDPKYPEVKIDLSNCDGNAFFILGRCDKQASRAGLSQEQIDEFHKEATSGNYDHLLQTCMKYFSCS